MNTKKRNYAYNIKKNALYKKIIDRFIQKLSNEYVNAFIKLNNMNTLGLPRLRLCGIRKYCVFIGSLGIIDLFGYKWNDSMLSLHCTSNLKAQDWKNVIFYVNKRARQLNRYWLQRFQIHFEIYYVGMLRSVNVRRIVQRTVGCVWIPIRSHCVVQRTIHGETVLQKNLFVHSFRFVNECIILTIPSK